MYTVLNSIKLKSLGTSFTILAEETANFQKTITELTVVAEFLGQIKYFKDPVMQNIALIPSQKI